MTTNFFKNINFKLFIVILLLIFIEASAQTLLEKASSITLNKKNNKHLFLIIGMLFYALVGYIYYIALSSHLSLAIVNIIWQTATIIVITLISIFYFNQKLSIKEIIGIIILIIGSLFFVPDKKKNN